jgi:hypothetical protein
MIDPKRLLADLKVQVRNLEQDLRQNEDDIARLRVEWEEARDARRTAADFEATWLPERITQVAVAWVLGTVFVRFCEDNGLLDDAFIAGPGDRTAQARERQAAYFQIEANQHKTDRDWLRAAFDEMKRSPAAEDLFNDRNPMHLIAPSQYAAKALIDFWRKIGADGAIIHDFIDQEWNTRFLVDLYQDLSDDAKKTYALLQTPEFVEKFILQLTLDPAIEEFGLEPARPAYAKEDFPPGFRLIDPACGSGHFLLGAFERLLAAWEDQQPGADRRVLVKNVLESIHGVDKNPYAAAIARFRLMLAAFKEASVASLSEKVEYKLHVYCGDSLLYGAGAPGEGRFFAFSTEDVAEYTRAPTKVLHSGTYHVVVGNPPYITVKDKYENEAYRAYRSCSGRYALSVPFAERMFQLSVRGPVDGAGAGYVGQITANSFMKREFGKKLIEEYFPNIDLTHVIDTSGAFIPGHGTPTVILIGRRRFSRATSTVRAVLAIRGELSEPPIPERGAVWLAIEGQVNRPGSESEWVSVADVPRDQFAKYPWSLSGGGASSLMMSIERSSRPLRDRIDVVGRTTHTGMDDCYYLPAPSARTRGLAPFCVPVILGEDVRDFSLIATTLTAFPYDDEGRPRLLNLLEQHFFWPNRTILRYRVDFGQRPEERGLRWFDHSMFFPDRFTAPLCIPFAFVATHNHFALDHGGRVFNRSAPVIKLPGSANEDAHLSLLYVLNSSTACFWLKQVSHDKGSQGINEGFKSQEWERFYEFTGKKLEQLPLPQVLPVVSGHELDGLAQQLTTQEPSTVCASTVPNQEMLDVAKGRHESIRAQMIALQEELDWDVYHRYGLISDAEATQLVADPTVVPELKLGERAFEIVLARRMRDEGFETQWFERHRSIPITEIPAHWPAEYRAVVEARVKIIQDNRNIGLIERPECKRRWQLEQWEDKERKALTNWLLDRCEERSLWFGPDGQQPVLMTVNRLADRLREDADVVSVARLLKNDPDADLAKVLAEIIDTEHVPYLAQLRYKAEGTIKRQQWERTWDLQRQEDATGEQVDIPVPPKYKNTDFQKPSYWRNRGKLDVPKERFISYPNASPDSDKSILLGWAGWDHREQALALYGLTEERQNVDGWDSDRVKPLVQGLAEVMPWVRQWHNEVDPAFGQSVADVLGDYLAAQRQRYGLSD